MTFNGWRNRATWVISAHFNPETLEDLDRVLEIFEQTVGELPPWLLDLIDDDIDWDGLRAGLPSADDDDE